MIPIHDENPTLQTPVVTIALLIVIAGVWLIAQGAGFDFGSLAASVCDWGFVAAEFTGGSPVGTAVPLAPGIACVVDDDPNKWLTPISSMFLHGSWSHLLGNALFLWIFGNNVEDSMGRSRFVVFYLLCGLVAIGAQTATSPASPVPMVGASGAISGILGGYLVLYPRVRVHMLVILIFYVTVIAVPAWLMLAYWFGIQLVSAAIDDGAGGVAFAAHVGGFAAGAALIKIFARPELARRRTKRR